MLYTLVDWVTCLSWTSIDRCRLQGDPKTGNQHSSEPGSDGQQAEYQLRSGSEAKTRSGNWEVLGSIPLRATWGATTPRCPFGMVATVTGPEQHGGRGSTCLPSCQTGKMMSEVGRQPEQADHHRTIYQRALIRIKRRSQFWLAQAEV